MPSKALDPEPEFVLGDPVADSADTASTVEGIAAPRRSSYVPAVVVILLAVIASGAAFYFFRSQLNAPAPPAAPSLATAPTTAPEPSEPAIRHPIENIPAASDMPQGPFPLPRLDDSDALAKDAIATAQNGDAWLRFLVPEGVVRHIVATVDGLPQKTTAAQVLPVRPVPGLMGTTAGPSGTTIAPDNSARYAAYVSGAEAIDAQRLAGFYVRLYPLFQQAYVELGYPKGYFNDRVIAVIDHLLTAPEPPPPIYVTQNKVLYEFADPNLENLSAGQKTLVRIGLDNERRVKAKLREIRKALAAEPPPR